MENLYDIQCTEVWMENVWPCNFLLFTFAGVTSEALSRVIYFFAFVFIVIEVVVAFCSHLTIENQWTFCFQKNPIGNKDGELGESEPSDGSTTFKSNLPQSTGGSQTAKKRPSESFSSSNILFMVRQQFGQKWTGVDSSWTAEKDRRAKGTVVVSSWAPHFHWKKTQCSCSYARSQEFGHSLGI